MIIFLVKNNVLQSNQSYIILDGMSDHYPCLLSYALTKERSYGECICIEKRKLNDDVMLKIQESLLFHDWSSIESMSTNRAYEYLINVITETLDYFAPKKIVKLSVDEKFREPWLTVQLMKYNRKCKKLCKRAKKSGHPDDMLRYKMYRNTLNRLKRFEKQKFYKEVFQKIGKNTKLLWNVINSMLKKRTNKIDIPKLFHKNRMLTNQEQICNAFNEHFSNAGRKVQASIGNVGSADPTTFVRPVNNTPKFQCISEAKLCCIVQT